MAKPTQKRVSIFFPPRVVAVVVFRYGETIICSHIIELRKYITLQSFAVTFTYLGS